MKKRDHKARNIVLLILLAAVCIGGCELAACRHFAPVQYEQIAAPVRRGAQVTASFCQDTASMAAAACADAIGRTAAFCSGVAGQAAQLWADLTAPPPEPEPEPEAQIADEPVPLHSAPVTDPLITELRSEDGRDILTGGVVDMVYFNQGDETWADQPFGTDRIGGYGCGPTALAMIVNSMTDTVTDPALMSQWAVDNHYWAPKGGSYLSIVEGIEEFGLEVNTVTDYTPDAIFDQLLSGNVLVALMGPGHFTQRGHFIVLRGVTLSGEVLVADPNSTERSLVTWDPQIILDELSASTSDGAPLWSVGVPASLTE